jgi:hypothetical protein
MSSGTFWVLWIKYSSSFNEHHLTIQFPEKFVFRSELFQYEEWENVTFLQQAVQKRLHSIPCEYLKSFGNELKSKYQEYESVSKSFRTDRLKRELQICTALCRKVQLYRYFMSQCSEFCRHNPLWCFWTSNTKGKLIFRYRLSSETSGYTLVQSV